MKFKRTLSALASAGLILGILVLPSVKAFAAVYNEVSINVDMQKQSAAIAAYKVYCRYIDSVYERDTKAASAGSDYPDWYCAEWIDDEGKLHIAIREDDKAAFSSVKKALAGCMDDVVFETMKFSYNELDSEAERLFDTLSNSGYIVSSCGVKGSKNIIQISLPQEDYDRSVEFRNMLSAQSAYPIEFLVQPMAKVQASELVAGTSLRTKNKYSWYTLSACGTYNGKTVAVTAGHCAPLNTVVQHGKTYRDIGKVIHRNFYDQASGDYEFIQITSSDFRASHRVFYSENSIQSFDGSDRERPSEGTVLKKYGGSTGLSQRVVVTDKKTSGLVDTDNGSFRICGFVQTRIENGDSLIGDSGGPYWREENGKRIYCGVHSSAIARGVTLFTPYEVLYKAGFRVLDRHVANWSNHNASYHKGYCSICEETAYEPHFAAKWNNYSASYHSGYCSICKATVYESHLNYLNPTGTKCLRCGRTGNFSGTSGFMPFPAEQQMDAAPFCGHDHN